MKKIIEHGTFITFIIGLNIAAIAGIVALQGSTPGKVALAGLLVALDSILIGVAYGTGRT